MDKAKLNLFDGAVSHRRVGNKKHQFEYNINQLSLRMYTISTQQSLNALTLRF